MNRSVVDFQLFSSRFLKVCGGSLVNPGTCADPNNIGGFTRQNYKNVIATAIKITMASPLAPTLQSKHCTKKLIQETPGNPKATRKKKHVARTNLTLLRAFPAQTIKCNNLKKTFENYDSLTNKSPK